MILPSNLQNYEQPPRISENSDFQSHFLVLKIGRIFPKRNLCYKYWTRIPGFIKNVFENFKVLYFLKMCPIFVGSVHYFGQWYYLVKKCLFPLNAYVISSVVSCPFSTKNLELYLTKMPRAYMQAPLFPIFFFSMQWKLYAQLLQSHDQFPTYLPQIDI